jgi:hypothetical protein
MRRQHVNVGVVDAVLRLIGGVFFATCDIAGPQAAAAAIESLRRFGDVNSDNRDCHALCHALADAQEDALHAKDYDFRQAMKTTN